MSRQCTPRVIRFDSRSLAKCLMEQPSASATALAFTQSDESFLSLAMTVPLVPLLRLTERSHIPRVHKSPVTQLI